MYDCAYYYDFPSAEDELMMKKLLQRKYDPILKEGWRPPLYTRKDLLTWACNQYVDTLKERPEVSLVHYPKCDNYG